MEDKESTIEELSEGLTDLQIKVVHNVVSGEYSSNTKAYLAAKDGEVSEDTAKANVSRMLADANVKPYYKALINKAALDSVISREQALEILSNMATTKITDIATYETIEHIDKASGKTIKQGVWYLKDSENLTDEQATSIMAVKATPQGVEIKQHDHKIAIKQLAEMMGWESEKKINNQFTVVIEDKDKDA